MGRKEETKQILNAFKGWVSDTPLRIAGWVMSLFVFFGAIIGIITWIWQFSPPLYVWLCFALVVVSVIWLSFIPYYKRERHRASSVITNMAYIEAFIIDGKEFLDGFKREVVVLTHDKNRAKQWQFDVAEYLRKNIPDEYILWHRYTAIDFQSAEQSDCIAFIETGLNRLETIHAILRQSCKRD